MSIRIPLVQAGMPSTRLVREPEVALKPDTLDFIDAASVPLAGGTAWQGVMDEAGIQAGQSILIHGRGRGGGLVRGAVC